MNSATTLFDQDQNHSIAFEVQRAVDFFARFTGENVLNLTTLVNAMANLDPSYDAFAPCSRALNSEGLPVELAITSHSNGVFYRLISDPACTTPDPSIRFARACDALAATLRVTGTEALAPEFERVIRCILPGSRPKLSMHGIRSSTVIDPMGQAAPFTNGPFCLGAATQGPGVAIYLDARTSGHALYDRVYNWLADCLPNDAIAHSTLDGMRTRFNLAAIGIEGKSPKQALAKIYWRPRTEFTLSDLDLVLLQDSRVPAFLRAAMREKSVDSNGLMISAGFSMTSGKLHDAKINLCGHCLTHGDEWAAVIEDCADILDIVSPQIADALAKPFLNISFITFGIDRVGATRMNVYIRPTRNGGICGHL